MFIMRLKNMNSGLDVVPKLGAAFIDSLMFFSKGPLGVSKPRGPLGRRKISANRLMPLTLGQTPGLKHSNTFRSFKGAIVFIFLITALKIVGDDSITVLCIPFADQVKMKDPWVLSVDVPRWYSETIDTIGEEGVPLSTVPFDSVLAVIKENRWNHKELLDRSILVRLGRRFHADYIVSGSVNHFLVMKRAINSDAMVETTNDLGRGTRGTGQMPVMGGLQTYTANIRMSVDIYDATTAQVERTLLFDSEEKDGGLKVWLPFLSDNDEINFHNMSRSPFGSVYFKKSVVGALMTEFSKNLKKNISTISSYMHAEGKKSEELEYKEDRTLSKEYLEGKILDRSGDDIYINLGIDDKLFHGEILEVLKPVRPVKSPDGDTLGWVEEVIGTVKVRSLKSSHFSVASVLNESDTITTGLTIRIQIGVDE